MTMLWKERSRNRAEQMDDIRGLLGVRRMDRIPNARIKKLCGVMNGVDEKAWDVLASSFAHLYEKYELFRKAWFDEYLLRSVVKFM